MEFVRNIPAHLDKHCGHKELMKVADHSVRNLGTVWGGVSQPGISRVSMPMVTTW